MTCLKGGEAIQSEDNDVWQTFEWTLFALIAVCLQAGCIVGSSDYWERSVAGW